MQDIRKPARLHTSHAPGSMTDIIISAGKHTIYNLIIAKWSLEYSSLYKNSFRQVINKSKFPDANVSEIFIYQKSHYFEVFDQHTVITN